MKFKLKSQCAGEVLEEHALQHRTDGTGIYKNLCAEYLTIIKWKFQKHVFLLNLKSNIEFILRKQSYMHAKI